MFHSFLTDPYWIVVRIGTGALLTWGLVTGGMVLLTLALHRKTRGWKTRAAIGALPALLFAGLVTGEMVCGVRPSVTWLQGIVLLIVLLLFMGAWAMSVAPVVTAFAKKTKDRWLIGSVVLLLHLAAWVAFLILSSLSASL
ncbi:hypothetical protein SAMN05444156_0238 [Verrucomicrobium sp. GAS474]|uniref:hypothetical protein n=1 Tax=Verrucomicrobium sp. GAS474 TaxID=1882831 RepID=UPI00087B70D4|nr:hypothetical protein [Verrucomicrobium sp. GAS474]SDT86845.1 hypothetical protein SAMN05444156_0238 [Verrucomicrobium sp. GAS474]